MVLCTSPWYTSCKPKLGSFTKTSVVRKAKILRTRKRIKKIAPKKASRIVRRGKCDPKPKEVVRTPVAKTDALVRYPVRYPIQFSDKLDLPIVTWRKHNYFPNGKVELMIESYQKTLNPDMMRDILEACIPIIDGMIHTHRIYAVEIDDLRNEGILILQKAIGWFNPAKAGKTTSAFSYFSWALKRGFIGVTGKKKRWYATHTLTEDAVSVHDAVISGKRTVDDEDPNFINERSDRVKLMLVVLRYELERSGMGSPYVEIYDTMDRLFTDGHLQHKKVASQLIGLVSERCSVKRSEVKEVFEMASTIYKDILDGKDMQKGRNQDLIWDEDDTGT